ncbi:hypothetical protein L873DRAFT_1674654 [Choiromyces venosus 120613-1]|uniref:Stress response protein ish1 n=1 Tax=Choiromyces venosus 120613-1 TaxID=1336337 RepID=A0A3N4JY75_9PEZI|nr:hypothetical protein L873DRAFT_1674654 [Choiromyces venosus 120613-1]
MKLSHIIAVAALASPASASSWFGKSAYNKWHENELERWLSDHGIPYSTPADRKELEKIVKDNWQTKVVSPYQEWDPPQLQSYLSEKGQELDKKRKEDKNWLVENVKKSWYETESATEESYSSVKNWIFDSWSESQLKAFLDRHGIPNPSPRHRDTLLSTARDNYQSVAKKLGETYAYPGNWVYESWSDSDLKKWLDEHGYPAPQPTTRDKLIAAVRKNSRLASLKLSGAASSASQSAQNAKNTVADSVFDSWSESMLKEFLDKNNVKVPQGSKKNEFLALARRNKAYYTGDTVSNSAASAYSSATHAGGEKVSQATDAASDYAQSAFDEVIESWSDARLKAYLDSRGVPVPQSGKRDELLAKVRLHKHKAATGYGAWTFDTWTYDNLKSWLESQGEVASSNVKASRDELYSSAVSAYSRSAAAATSAGGNAASSASSVRTNAASSVSSAASEAASGAASAAGSAGSAGASSISSAGSRAGEAATNAASAAYASMTSALAQATATAKDATFDTWSDSDLKAYLDTYGIQTYQGSTRNELIAAARRNSHAFLHGSHNQGVTGQFQAALRWVIGQISNLLGTGTKAAEKVGDRAYEKAQTAYDATKEKSQQAYDRAKEEL